jgi:hypothetical protein
MPHVLLGYYINLLLIYLHNQLNSTGVSKNIKVTLNGKQIGGIVVVKKIAKEPR